MFIFIIAHLGHKHTTCWSVYWSSTTPRSSMVNLYQQAWKTTSLLFVILNHLFHLHIRGSALGMAQGVILHC